ncbi:MAG: adenosylcobinamide-phosphate synthase CbiB [Proteobacteria bacterium]|nr:adenosylcobinamide-phosphate synthase CbiB [Pseudomonadota bacterium]MBU1231953.1 adenosylcobinamide-phosphate synthase CbiB [Pseudomonadota bacterium]MBU1420512.1 adenosylcobinamide-phosphate synthase CbiB [Pseudomonadota bacterium]MBU1456075.1 adenosylcobinamide-phosphate synthase CbiB [Pseudomonadota bacterium]
MHYLFELQLLAAVLLDLLCGDPRWFPHPVRLIGLFITWCEAAFCHLVKSPFLAGGITVTSVLVLTLGLSALLLAGAVLVSSVLAQALAVFFLYTSVAARDLVAHSKTVYLALRDANSLDPARVAVSRIVGRDTATLSRAGIVRACVETVAENMVDGVTAPLFYGILLSLFAPLTGINPIFLAALGAMGYKAVNTMDSMIGYKNDRYLLFGRCAARLDDLVNFFPARISGLLLVPAALLLGLDWQGAFTVFVKDRLKHASPNAGHPEAAVAGALGVQLGGVSNYFGKAVSKPCIGESSREIESGDILQANKLMLLGSFLFLLLMLLLRQVFLSLLNS